MGFSVGFHTYLSPLVYTYYPSCPLEPLTTGIIGLTRVFSCILKLFIFLYVLASVLMLFM